MTKPTKIERIAAGEIMIVPLISEDLQQMYDDYQDKLDNFKRAMQEAKEKIIETKAKSPDDLPFEFIANLFTLDYEHHISKLNFWQKVRMQYKIAHDEIGIRDGYSIVKIPAKNTDPKEIIKIILSQILKGNNNNED